MTKYLSLLQGQVKERLELLDRTLIKAERQDFIFPRTVNNRMNRVFVFHNHSARSLSQRFSLGAPTQATRYFESSRHSSFIVVLGYPCPAGSKIASTSLRIQKEGAARLLPAVYRRSPHP